MVFLKGECENCRGFGETGFFWWCKKCEKCDGKGIKKSLGLPPKPQGSGVKARVINIKLDL